MCNNFCTAYYSKAITILQNKVETMGRTVDDSFSKKFTKI